MIDGKIIPRQTMASFESGQIAHVPFFVGSNSYEIGLFPVLAAGLSHKMAPVWPKVEALYDGFGSDNVDVIETQVQTDIMLTEPTRELARAGRPTYAYYYSYVNPTLRAKYPGAPHFFEVPAVLGTMSVIEPHPGPETPRVVEAMHSRWVAFAKTGGPGRWPAFAKGHEQWLTSPPMGQWCARIY
jgi:para-nitrobenzyl esterase